MSAEYGIAGLFRQSGPFPLNEWEKETLKGMHSHQEAWTHRNPPGISARERERTGKSL